MNYIIPTRAVNNELVSSCLISNVYVIQSIEKQQHPKKNLLLHIRMLVKRIIIHQYFKYGPHVFSEKYAFNQQYHWKIGVLINLPKVRIWNSAFPEGHLTSQEHNNKTCTFFTLAIMHFIFATVTTKAYFNQQNTLKRGIKINRLYVFLLALLSWNSIWG